MNSLLQWLKTERIKHRQPEPFKPVHSPYKTLDETLKAFNAGRDSLINYVQTTQDDLRDHIAVLPLQKLMLIN